MSEADRLEEIRDRWYPGTVVYQSEAYEWLTHAVRDIPHLLSEIDRLREALERLREALGGPGPQTEKLKVRAREISREQAISPANLSYLAARLEWRLSRARQALTDSEGSGDG